MAEIDYNYIGELVERAKNGDSDAFAELYLATYQKQYLFCYNYLGDEYLAQDALQETYIRALKNLGSLEDPKLFISWLNQINLHVCYSMKEKKNRSSAELENYAAGMADDVASDDSPENHVVKIDDSKYIFNEILALPGSESNAIILHYYKNLPIKEIAYIMDVSKSTVKRYLDSGRKRLAKTLKA